VRIGQPNKKDGKGRYGWFGNSRHFYLNGEGNVEKTPPKRAGVWGGAKGSPLGAPRCLKFTIGKGQIGILVLSGPKRDLRTLFVQLGRALAILDCEGSEIC